MKKILILMCIVAGLFSCKDDDSAGRFDVSVPEGMFSFEAVPGGALMRYAVEDIAIRAVRVKYTNGAGVEVFKQATYSNTMIELDGFNEPMQNVPIEVWFVNVADQESEHIELTFSTSESAAYAVLQNAEVSSYWNGFQLKYTTPESVSGYANVFYIGTNPMTNELDTLLLRTFVIKPKGDLVYFTLDQDRDYNTVIVTTEDFKGYVAGSRSWKEVETYFMEKIDNSIFELDVDPSIRFSQSSTYYTGTEYLFDGDVKGDKRYEATKSGSTQTRWYSFVAGPRCLDKPMVLDIKAEHEVATIRIYGFVNIGGTPGFELQGDYWNKLPCKITVSASNDKDADDWVEVAVFDQAAGWDNLKSRWYYVTTGEYPKISTQEDYDAAKPAYLDITMPIGMYKYRYYKLVVNKLFEPNPFDPAGYRNEKEYVSFNEIEVFIKK